MTCWLVESGMMPGSLEDCERWTSYRDIAARSRYTVGRMRCVGGERSVMEKRMPLLECVGYILVFLGSRKGVIYLPISTSPW